MTILCIFMHLLVEIGGGEANYVFVLQVRHSALTSETVLWRCL